VRDRGRLKDMGCLHAERHAVLSGYPLAALLLVGARCASLLRRKTWRPQASALFLTAAAYASEQTYWRTTVTTDNGSSSHSESRSEQHARPSEKKVQANQRNAMKSTGPRTPEGKARSSQNARTHRLTGVLPITAGEGKEDHEAFEEMRMGLYQYWRPEGLQEHHLVELLAGDYWRLQRADRYEAGMTRKFADHATHDRQVRETIRFHTRVRGAALGMTTVFFAETCQGIDYQIEFLRDMSEQLELEIDLSEHQLLTIRGLFGEPGRCFATLCLALWTLNQESRKEQKQEAAAEYRNRLMEVVAQQIQSLQEKRKVVATREESELEAELLTVSLPPWLVLDKLARYTTMIFRRIDRTLNQLERLQRLRKGEYVPAPMTVQVSVETPVAHNSSDLDDHAVGGSEQSAAPESISGVTADHEEKS
jgi:hypothetical protein